MKRVVIAWNLGRGSEKIRRLLVSGRTFAILSIGSMLLVIMIGIGVIAQQQSAAAPLSSMKAFAAAASDGLFGHMLAMEMPGAKQESNAPLLSGKKAGTYLVNMLTDIDLADPHSLLAGEYPGMGDGAASGGTEPAAGEQAGGDTGSGGEGGGQAGGALSPDGSGRPDRGPSGGDAGGSEAGAGNGGAAGTGKGDTADGGHATDGGSAAADGGASNAGANGPNSDGNAATGGAGEQPGTGTDAAQPTTGGHKVVFIYHSHSRESWFPELNGAKTAESATTNVTLLGKRLQEKLEDEGIGALHSSTDYVTAIKNYNWALSYKYSKKTVTEAIANNKDLKFFFDIHRDSLRRKDTTATIGGKTYAQVFLIIGRANPGWQKNEAFAEEINAELDKRYPGLTKGILGKSTSTGNGEYNQSLSPDSVLIEVGGVDNTLEECYRTVDALAGVIGDLYWDAEKAGAFRSTDS